MQIWYTYISTTILCGFVAYQDAYQPYLRIQFLCEEVIHREKYYSYFHFGKTDN